MKPIRKSIFILYTAILLLGLAFGLLFPVVALSGSTTAFCSLWLVV
jgi:hypothetical protein